VDLSGVLNAIARVEEIEAAAQRASTGFAPLLELVAPELGPTQTLAAFPQVPDAALQPSVGGSWVEALPPEGRKFAEAIERAARAAGLDPRLLAALAWTESGFRPDAVSTAGAVGLTQLMPTTAAGLGVDPHDPIQNLEGGARYLAAQIRRFGSLELGLAAYVAGPGAVSAAGGIPSANAGAYVRRVLERLVHLGGDPTAIGATSAGRIAPGRAAPVPVGAGAAAPGEREAGRTAPAEVAAARAAPAEAVSPRGAGGPVEGAAEHPHGPLGPSVSRARQAQDRTGSGAAEPLGALHRPPAEGVVGSAPSADMPRDGVTALAVGRVLEVVERIRDQAPPRQVAVELPEMDGLRVLVEARATTVHVRPVGGDPSGVWYEALMRDLGPGLAARGFDLAGDLPGEGSFRGRPETEDPWTRAAPPAPPAVRVRSEGVRL
jgi:hypothetical protein